MGRYMRRSIGNVPSTKKAMTGTGIQFAFRLTAISCKLVIFNHTWNDLLNDPAVLEIETPIICPVGMSLDCNSLIIQGEN
jgi:hypothetical protein